jgi:seryl-tRNA synthetase
MTKEAEKVLKILNIPYRIIKLCGGDIGDAASTTYDLEV